MPETHPSHPSDLPFPMAPEIIFANWREALHQAGLSPAIQTVYAMALSGYLEYCAPISGALFPNRNSKPGTLEPNT